MCNFVLALTNEVSDLRSQLQEACRQNRKLQERCDEETDNSRQLNANLERLSRDLDESKSQAKQKIEEYETKVLDYVDCVTLFWPVYLTLYFSVEKSA